VTNADRTAHHPELEAILARIFATRPRHHWLRTLTDASVPCAPIANVEEVTRDPHLAARNMILHAEHSEFDGLIVPGSPLKSASAGDDDVPSTRAPRLGESTDEVLKAVLGYDDLRLSELRKCSII
jgi:crotonobetainyl-CoA:carnitine CoA-transferase CaiB-like acyl-CoA transferase